MATDPKVMFQVDADLKAIKAKLDQLEGEFNDLQGEGVQSGDKIGSSFAGLQTKVLAVGAALASVYATVKSLGKLVETAGEFEALEVRLVNLYQSVEKGNEVFGEFKHLAATTPFSLQSVVEGGAALKAFGLDAENTLKSVTDLAAFMGTDVVYAAQAVGRAFAGGAGAADVLRERGVLNLIKSFKGIDDLTKITLPEFRQALIETMQDPTAGIAGATDRLSRTYVGAVSNMRDALDQLAAHIGFKFLPAAKGMAEQVGRLAGDLLPKESDALRDQQIEFTALFNILQDTNTEQQIRSDVIDTLKKQYGKYLGDLDVENASYEELAEHMQEVNKEFERRIALAANEEMLAEKARTVTDAYKLYMDRLIKLRKLEAAGPDGKTQLALDMHNTALGFASIRVDALKESWEKANGQYAEFKQLLMDAGDWDEIQSKQDKVTQATDGHAESMKKLVSEMRVLDGELARLGGPRGSLEETADKFEEMATNEDNQEIFAKMSADINVTTENLINAKMMLQDFNEQLLMAAMNGRGLEGLVDIFKRIIAQLAALTMTFGIMQLIPGGSAFTGGIGGFIGRGLGFSMPQANSSPASIQITGALPGQEFTQKTITPAQASINRRKF